MLFTLKCYGFHAQIYDQMVFCTSNLYVPVLIDIIMYVKVYPYFIILCTKREQDWDPTTSRTNNHV